MNTNHQSPNRRPGRHNRFHIRQLAALAAAATLLVGITACGSDDDSSNATTAPVVTDSAATTDAATTIAPTSSAAESADTTMAEPVDTADSADTTMAEPDDTAGGSTAPDPAEASIANAITITTPGMAYDVSGPLRPGVAAITLTNTSEEAHMMSVGRLADGVTLDQINEALTQDDEDALTALLADGGDASIYGTPAPVGAGESSTVTSTDLQPGDYGIICFFTDDEGTPHFAMGMVNTFTVEGEQATETPDSDGTITIDDEGTTMPDDFTGQGTFLVTNDGTSLHSMSIARLDEGTTLDAYYGFVGGQMNSGKAIDGGGGVLVGGVDGLLPGQSAYLTLDLPSGNYGYLSMDDANGPTLPVQSGEFDVS